MVADDDVALTSEVCDEAVESDGIVDAAASPPPLLGCLVRPICLLASIRSNIGRIDSANKHRREASANLILNAGTK